MAIFSAADASGQQLRIGGTGSALGVMKLLGAEFKKDNPDVELTVLPSLGSGGGIKALNAGVIDIAVSARPLREKERKLGLKSIRYGSTAVVFAGNTKVAETDLTTARLIEIYSSSTAKWSDGVRIRVVLRPDVETDTKLLKIHIPGMAAALASARTVPGVPVAITDQDTAMAMERLPGSLGTAALSLLLSERRALKIFSLNGVTANLTTIRAGTYPMVKTFRLVTASGANAFVRRFVAFLRSPRGIRILEENGHAVHFGEALR